MINPETLPSLPLSAKAQLPDCPAIYFVMDGEAVLYIGKAVNLLARWKGHHRFHQISKSYPSARLAWMQVVDTSVLTDLESTLIERLVPLLNNALIAGEDRPRPKRSRPTDRVNYKLDKDIRAMLTRISERQGRNEGSQVEQLVLFYEACQRINNDGEPLTMDAISVKVSQIWDELMADAMEVG